MNIGLNYSGIGFVNEELAPAIVYANDGVIIDAKRMYESIERDNYEEIFLKEVSKCDCTNKWLKDYIDEKNLFDKLLMER